MVYSVLEGNVLNDIFVAIITLIACYEIIIILKKVTRNKFDKILGF